MKIVIRMLVVCGLAALVWFSYTGEATSQDKGWPMSDKDARAPSLAGAMGTVTSHFTTSPPSIDGLVSAGEWNNAASLTLPHGTLYLQHDAKNLYILMDIAKDTQQDLTNTNDINKLTYMHWPP